MTESDHYTHSRRVSQVRVLPMLLRLGPNAGTLVGTSGYPHRSAYLSSIYNSTKELNNMLLYTCANL